MENVEILVPNHSVAKVKRALGGMRATRFVSAPSQRSTPRLLVAWLPDLEVVERQQEFRSLWEAASRIAERRTVRSDVPLIFLTQGGGKSYGSGLLQLLVHLSRVPAREPYVAPSPEAVRRLVLARQQGSAEDLIASAAVEDGRLVVWSCEPRRFDVPIADISALAALSPNALRKFEVSTSGSRIHWPDADVDINLDTIRVHADPGVRREHEALARKEAARYADAIRSFREERGLKQAQIDGLTDRQVRRLEQGETMPRIDTLKKLAAAHGMGIGDYLKELAKRSRKASKRPASARRRRAVRRAA